MICLCASTRRAARLLTQRYEEALRPAHLTPAQFELLATLSHHPGISQSSLAKELALDQTTLSRNLKSLLERSYIQRAASPKDGRQTNYSLTAAGNQALQDATPLWKSIHQQMQDLLVDQWQPTIKTLGLLHSSLSSEPDHPTRSNTAA
jgi:DNA-binding MarR family transcriptional regulator